ncbi:MAG TPA: type II toxin-antitoxin system Phd/YefM family antitoxin [Acidobacteriaceae bacterium]
MWQVQEAKAKFSEFLDKALHEGPQVVSKRGVATAVLVPIEEWERLQKRARPTLKDLLLADEPRFEIDLPPRGKWKSRPVIRFEDE